MPKRKAAEPTQVRPKIKPATNPVARENQMIALAVDCAEEKLRDRTASPQIIVHYLKLGSTREKLEQEMLEEKNELMKKQREALEASQRIEGLYQKAIDALKMYSGNGGEPIDD